jgi:hypothetical protein
MKETATVVTSEKGMGLVEVSKLCAPKRFRRKGWAKDKLVYWAYGENDESDVLMFEDSGDVYSPNYEDVIATDWEIIK